MSTFQDVIWSLKNLQQVFSLLYMSSKCDPNLEIQLIADTFNAIFQTSYTECNIENSLNILSAFNHKNLINIVNLIDEKLENKTCFCSSIYTNCKFCQNKLQVKKGSPCVLFGKHDMKYCISLIKTCNTCNVKYFIDKYEKDNVMHSDRMTEYISTSSESVFEVIILHKKCNHF